MKETKVPEIEEGALQQLRSNLMMEGKFNKVLKI